ncbi:MAG: alpha-L-fucosidase [Bacteroidales bacterium]|jgi:alpha-L-fucosidase|nr:alpha-L-fucosidase [Bacteroidales bacterium]MDI9592561.1 alpha-L-fucosidase [Bacteroidota bacterium]HOF80866.1 alpha-L-fucosidase [Bacteroidales bacterium]HOR76165.1 alpha-L-fucosidase [Bacteroidales bacterium]HPL11618.1 alpha-L-fucosidase [Bacteroidales bacterium]
MKSKIILLTIVLFITNVTHSFGQTKIDSEEIADKMQWFADAKLGIFIHTGIYAVNGITESWSFFNKRISHDDYMKQLNGFTMSKYDAAAWADLIKASGARYAVITTKHHDGVAMYNTQMNDLSSLKATPAAKDIIKPFYNELRQRDIKCGAYFSLLDWSHDNYPGFLRDSGRYEIKDDWERWYRYRDFFQGQIKELLAGYNPDLWWFDGDWELSAERWEAEKIRQMILTHNPNAIINGRLQGYGDYATPEQNFPVVRPKHNWWELCMTTNNSWGFQFKDQNWKTPYEVITIFADVISNGGNLLLDIGPKEDGTFPPEQINILKELGQWNKKHNEAIFNSLPGLPPGHFYGPTTLSKDSTNIYLFLAGNPQNQIVVRGLFDNIENVSIVGSDISLEWKIVGKISWSLVPGLVYIQVPEKYQDQYMTVIKIKLKDKVHLYRGEGGLDI